MSGPVKPNPVPEWLRPENASVLDSPLEKAIKALAGLLGATDPQSQVMGLLNPTDDLTRANYGKEMRPPQASDVLKQHGIPGIKYLDQGSRTAGEGTRNYVVFDDKLIDILRKYGMAGAALYMLGKEMEPQPVHGPQ